MYKKIQVLTTWNTCTAIKEANTSRIYLKFRKANPILRVSALPFHSTMLLML